MRIVAARIASPVVVLNSGTVGEGLVEPKMFVSTTLYE